MKYALVTFGCRVNQADSLAIEDGLRARGGTATCAEDAELVVVNTCSVTASADQAARPDDPADQPHESERPNRGDRLLCDPPSR
jgi:hypothetical protein